MLPPPKRAHPPVMPRWQLEDVNRWLGKPPDWVPATEEEENEEYNENGSAEDSEDAPAVVDAKKRPAAADVVDAVALRQHGVQPLGAAPRRRAPSRRRPPWPPSRSTARGRRPSLSIHM